MMWLWQVLAQAAAHTEKVPSPPPPPPPPPEQIPPDYLGYVDYAAVWQFIQSIRWIEAAVAIAFGVIYLTYGWRIFKALVIINFAGIGMFLGMKAGARLGSPLWGGVLMTIALATLSYPFLKFGVAALGGIAGGVLGGAAWQIFGLPDRLVPYGALAGAIAGCFLVFANYKSSVLLFTSLQGAIFTVAGALALMNHFSPEISVRLTEAIYTHKAFLPSLVIAPTLLGIFFQHKLHKADDKWAMPT